MKYTAAAIALVASTASAAFLRSNNKVVEEEYNADLVPGEAPRELQNFAIEGFKANIQYPTGTFPKGFLVVELPTGTFDVQPDITPTPPVPLAPGCPEVEKTDEYVVIEYGDVDTKCVDVTDAGYQERIADIFMMSYTAVSTPCLQPEASTRMYDVEFVTMGVGTNSMLIRTGSYGNGVAAKNGDYEKCGVDLFGAGLKDDCSCPPPSHDAVLTEFNININKMIVDDCVAGSTSGVITGARPAPVAWATEFSQTCEIRCINPVPGVDIAAVERTTSFTKAGVVPPCNKVAFTLSPAPTISPAPTAADPTAPPTSLPTRRPTNRPTNRPTRRPVEEDEPTEAPVDPTESPVDPTESPVDPTEAPVDPTEAPVDPTEAPVDPPDPTEAPVDPTEAPVDPTEAPVDPTEAPVEPTEAPVEPEPESSSSSSDEFTMPPQARFEPDPSTIVINDPSGQDDD